MNPTAPICHIHHLTKGFVFVKTQQMLKLKKKSLVVILRLLELYCLTGCLEKWFVSVWSRQACSSHHRLVFGFASDGICLWQTQPKLPQILRRQCCLVGWVAQQFCDIYWRDTEQTDWTRLTYFQCGFPSFPRRSKESKYFSTHNQNLSVPTFWMRWGHISWRGIKTTYKNIHYFPSLGNYWFPAALQR